MKRILLVTGMLLLLSGVGNSATAKAPQPQPAPVIDVGMTHAVSAYTVAEASASHMMRPLNDARTVLYEQSYGGGGVGLGLLLGPLGVAANVAAIKSRTEKEAAELYGKLAIDPQALLASALANTDLKVVTAADDPHAALLKPLLDVVSMGDQTLRFGAVLHVDHNPAGKNWVGHYLWQLPTVYPRAAVVQGLSDADRQALEQQATVAFGELVQLYMKDAAGALTNGATVGFHAPFMAPRFGFRYVANVVPGPQDRLTARMPTMLVSFPKDLITLDK